MPKKKISKENQQIIDNYNELFEANHDYLFKAHKLARLYVSRKDRGITKRYVKAIKSELHLLNKLFKKHPELKQAFKFKVGSKSHKKAIEIYYKFMKSKPKDVKKEEKCMFNTLFQAHINTKNLDRILRDCHDKVLLEHALIAMCTSYELYCRDSLLFVLNNFPEYGKKYLGTLGTPVKDLAKYDFGALEQAGEIFYDKECKYFKLFENGKKHYDNLIEMDLFPDEKTELYAWKVFQTRHCIIHNGGKADIHWKSKTGKEELDLQPRTLIKYIEFMHELFHHHWLRLGNKLFNDDFQTDDLELDSTEIEFLRE